MDERDGPSHPVKVLSRGSKSHEKINVRRNWSQKLLDPPLGPSKYFELLHATEAGMGAGRLLLKFLVFNSKPDVFQI